MKSSLTAILVSVLAIQLAAPTPVADACGVKLAVKGGAHRKGVSRTSNPSDVLLLGSPPRRLQGDLSAAGHRVEVASNAGAAKRPTYAIVVTDQAHSEEARAKFKGAVVLVRSGDVVADMRTVEKNVARKPVAAETGPKVIAAREDRVPVAAGPIQPKREIVTAAQPTGEAEPAATAKVEARATPTPTRTASPTVTPTRTVATATPPPPEPKPVATKPAIETKPAAATVEVAPKVDPKPVAAAKPVAVKAPKGGRELYFAFGSAAADTASLAATVQWLSSATDVNVVVEGHADPVGSADANQALSQRRAEFVRDYLVSAGIDGGRIEVAAFGSTKLKYGAADRRNRRAAVVAK